MEVNKPKATSVCANIVKALIKPMIPKGRGHELSQLAYITYPVIWKCACARIAEGLGLCRPNSKAKAQTKSQAAFAALAPRGAQAPKKTPV